MHRITETVTFNISLFVKSRASGDDYIKMLYPRGILVIFLCTVLSLATQLSGTFARADASPGNIILTCITSGMDANPVDGLTSVKIYYDRNAPAYIVVVTNFGSESHSLTVDSFGFVNKSMPLLTSNKLQGHSNFTLYKDGHVWNIAENSAAFLRSHPLDCVEGF